LFDDYTAGEKERGDEESEQADRAHEYLQF
jgi:hypothetical protein